MKPTPPIETRETVNARDLFANGLTRTAVHARHALLAPDGFVPGILPGWRTTARCFTVISPALGARSFTQLYVELPQGANGHVGGTRDVRQRLIYLLSGEVEITVVGRKQILAAGGFAYVPTQRDYWVEGLAPETRMLIFEKPYSHLPGVPAPGVLFGQVEEMEATPFLGDPDAMLTQLLPEKSTFDMAVNVFRFAPGASLPFVETHVMEHGLLMLSGRGIYRLEDRWYPVRAGDAIWMAPFCPQWFGALGREGASYIYYKDVNRG